MKEKVKEIVPPLLHTDHENEPEVKQIPYRTQTLIDVVSGFAGGSARVLIGNPFDLIKVRMQT